MDTPAELPAFDNALASGLDAPGASRARLEAAVLPACVQRCRWFGGKAREPRKFQIREVIPMGPMRILFVAVEYADSVTEIYLMPVMIARGEMLEELSPDAFLARGADCGLIDALHDENARAALFRTMELNELWPGSNGALRGVRGDILDPAAEGVSRLLKVEQSNSAIIYGERFFLKLYRKLEAGVNPDAEISRFLSERQGFHQVPSFAGALEYETAPGGLQVLGLALALVPNRGDGWSWALAQVGEFFARVPTATATADDTDLLGGDVAARIRQLGISTGELHRALAADAADAAFAPEPFTRDDAAGLAAGVRESAARLAARLDRVRALVPQIESRIAQLSSAGLHTAKIRTHGDYHLGQVLDTGAEFVIIDFEGEPSRPLAERRLKRSPLRDVAGMLRSFHYAAHASLVGREDRATLEPWAARWAQAASRIFLEGWREAARGAVFLPASDAEFAALLDAFLLEKALYEIAYEMNNRPEWLPIPISGLEAVLKA
jgi:trehalose synthase-fused probable maltokinase